MPPKKNKKKTKVKKRDRNEKVTSCEGCSKELDKHDFIYCVCTRVRFCSESCQHDHPHEECPGPPETTFNMSERLNQYEAQGLSNLSASSKAKQNKENRETVQKPSAAYILSKGIQNLKSPTAWDYAKWADEGDASGNQACAYLAGSFFRHRILGTPALSAGRGRREHQFIAHNKKEHNIPVLESQELAFTYFEKAAKLGHGLSMQSLGTCFDEAVGCRENRRRCNDWLWRSCLSNSHGAIELLDSKALLPLEVNAQSQMLDQVLHHLTPGQGMALCGPNLASLLLVFLETIKDENYSLRPFFSPWATGAVNSRPRSTEEGPRIPLIGSDAIKQFAKKVDFMAIRSHEIQCSYGRRGTSKSATAMTHGAASRNIDNQLFYAPPFSACDERFTKEGYGLWAAAIQMLSYSDPYKILFPFCVHVEKTGERRATSPYCRECEAEAKERLEAVAFGSVVLSDDEDIPHRGQAAVWKRPDGSLKIEGWKSYACGEAECVLAIIAASGLFPYVHPLFIAQDPNFFWPLIYNHGSIRAALEFVAPHIDWDEKMGTVKINTLEQRPIIGGCSPGLYLRKCGNNFCNHLEHYRAHGFQKCSRCERRMYCSKACFSADWQVHKLECNTSKKKQAADPRIGLSEEAPTEELKLKYGTKLNEGDDVVVDGLQAKPQYNGKVGVVGKTADNGRIALTLRTDDKHTLSIKPDNLYCLGVHCRSRRKKSRVFECVHGLQVCATCYFDFSTVNRLTQFKYSGQDFTSPLAIEQVNDTYFSSFELGPDGCFSGEKDWPMECVGMEKHTKQRFILKALLDTKPQMTLHAHVAQTAFITFGGSTKYPVLRALTRLDKVAQLL